MHIYESRSFSYCLYLTNDACHLKHYTGTLINETVSFSGPTYEITLISVTVPSGYLIVYSTSNFSLNPTITGGNLTLTVKSESRLYYVSSTASSTVRDSFSSLSDYTSVSNGSVDVIVKYSSAKTTKVTGSIDIYAIYN